MGFWLGFIFGFAAAACLVLGYGLANAASRTFLDERENDVNQSRPNGR